MLGDFTTEVSVLQVSVPSAYVTEDKGASIRGNDSLPSPQVSRKQSWCSLVSPWMYTVTTDWWDNAKPLEKRGQRSVLLRGVWRILEQIGVNSSQVFLPVLSRLCEREGETCWLAALQQWGDEVVNQTGSHKTPRKSINSKQIQLLRTFSLHIISLKCNKEWARSFFCARSHCLAPKKLCPLSLWRRLSTVYEQALLACVFFFFSFFHS